MSNDVTEALLEIHFHRAIVDAFAGVFGAGFLHMLKPSTQREVWVGFDQGWVHTSVPDADLYQHLSNTINVSGHSVGGFHIGYFLQYKVAHELQRRSRFTPPTFGAPHLRSELSVWTNPTTGLSQHETLCRLAAIEGSLVYYVCPLVFNVDQIYENPDLDSLQAIDVASAPSGIDDNDRHFIYFQSNSVPNPHWCSEPVPAKSLRLLDWVRDETFRPRRRTTDEIIELIDRAKEALYRTDPKDRFARRFKPLLPHSFTILSFGS